MRRFAVVLIVIGFVFGGISSVLAVNPDVDGSTPVYTDEDLFSAGGWDLTVYSYVYDNTSASLPGVLELDPGEMLFMYLLDAHATNSSSIEHFAVGNPDLMTINTVGVEDSVTPAGYGARTFDDPYIFGYSGPSEATIYTFFGDFADPWVTLDPDEYSLVYYIAIAGGYMDVSASADAEGMADTLLVPGPTVPEPATICMLGLGALALLRKRRRTA